MAINKTTQFSTDPNSIPVDTNSGSETLQTSLNNRTINTSIEINVGGSSDYTLTTSEASYSIITLTGEITSDISIIFPAIPREYVVRNSTTGTFDITAKTSMGSGVVVTGVTLINSDGVDIFGDYNFASTPKVSDESVLVENTSGVVIQQAFASTGAVVSSTSPLPYDDTIPQNTEGAEALSVAFTPKRSDSRIRITTTLQLRSSDVDGLRTAAIFVSTQSDALAVGAAHGDPANGVGTGIDSLNIVADVASSSTAARTYSSRFGQDGTDAIYLNGDDFGVRRYGGAYASTLEIMEYMP